MTEQEKSILKEFIDLAGDAAKAPMLMAAKIAKLRAERNAFRTAWHESSQLTQERRAERDAALAEIAVLRDRFAVMTDKHVEARRALDAAQKQVLGLRDCLEFVRDRTLNHDLACTKAIDEALFAPAPDLSFVKILVAALEANTGGDLASGEGIYKSEIAYEALAATKADREKWGL